VCCCLTLQIGGTPALLKYLHANGLIDGTCLTVTGVCVSALALSRKHRLAWLLLGSRLVEMRVMNPEP
jgi:dihydroxyacid dehydratase/phosphogluconate dehydratase